MNVPKVQLKTPAQLRREAEMEAGRKRVEHYSGERILAAPPVEEPEVTEPGKRKTKAELKAEAAAAAAAAEAAADDEPL